MSTYTIYGDKNFDTAVTPSVNATLDVYNINGAKLTIDTDTRYCASRFGAVTAGSNGSVDTVTISSSLGGELLIDGTNVKIIPYKSGSGTPNVQSIALAITAATWASSVVTITTATHSLSTGDYVGIGGMEPNAYNGIYQVTVTGGTTFTYELASDPGISTITNGQCCKYWTVRQPIDAAAKTITAGSWSSNITTVTAAGHGYTANDYILIAGATPAAYNGYWKLTSVTTDTFNFTQYASPGTWSSGGTSRKTAQGFFLGFWSALNVAGNPQGTTAAAAISATGFLKVKGVLGGPFVAGNTITIQASTPPTVVATASEDTGWIEVVGQTTGIITTPRLGKTTMTGSWFYPKLVPIVTTGTTWSANVVTLTFAAAHNITVGSIITVSGATVSPSINGTWTVASVPLSTTLTYALTGSGGADGVVNVTTQICTSGVANQTVQLPASTTLTYYAGVWIETGVGTGTYEFYPSAGSLVAASSIATDAARGKVCWISSQGLLRLGHDGTNTNGYVPVSGCKIRVNNINLVNATRATSPGVGPNVANTATMTARQTWVSTGGNTGIINIDNVTSSWYCNFVQTSSLSITNTAITEGMGMSEIAAAYTLNNVGIGQSLALVVTALTQSLCFAGGTETNCVWSRYSQVSTYVNSRTDVFNLTITGERVFGFTLRTSTAPASEYLLRCSNLSFTNTKIIGSQVLMTSCSDITFTTSSYADTVATTTGTGNPMYVFQTTTKCNNIKIDGLDFFGVTNVQPYSGLLLVAVNSSNIKLRNIGTSASPLSLGSANNTAYIIASAAGAGCSNIEVKRVYTSLTRTGIHNFDNSLSGVVFENVWGDVADTMTAASLNMQIKGMRATQVTTGQTAIYGHHFQDFWPSTTTGKIVLAMNEKTSTEPSASSYTATQLSLPSGFNSAGVIQMPLLNDEVTWETPYYLIGHTGFTVAAPTIISPTSLTVTAGSWTSSYTSLTCGTHGLTAGDTVVVTGVTPAAYNGVFIITNIVSATVIRYYQASNPGTWSSGGNILQLDNIDMFYYLNQGTSYGTKKNLKYNRTGGATTSGTAAITMTDTTGVVIGDYVTSKIAGAGASARVTSIDTGTQVTVNVNSSATTAGNVFYFNYLPFETVTDASVGFKLKVALKTWANCNTAAVTNIAIPTISTSTAQAYQYPLDVYTLTLTGLQTGSDVVVLNAGTSTERVNVDNNSGSSYNFSYYSLGNIDIGLFKAGYKPFYIRNYPLTASAVSLPCVQVPDSAYY